MHLLSWAYKSIVPLYPSLKWLTFDVTEWPKKHSLLEFSGDLREVPRIAVHLKIVTGTYILQTNRHSFNQNQVDPLCLDLNNRETLLRLLIDCSAVIAKTVSEVIFHIRRLCNALHIERYRRLSVVPGRKEIEKLNPENSAPV